MKPTMRDVARLAGVSSMAVSYVLHGTGRNVRVSEETAERIRQTASDLNYQANNLARNLRSGKTKMIGVVFQHFLRLGEDNPYYPQLLNGVMAALFPADYTLALCPKLVQNGDIGAMLDGRFDGVLWARPDFTDANVETLRSARTPMVMMHAPPGSAEGVATFSCDNDGAMKLVVDHLATLGHDHVAFVIDEVNQVTAEGRARLEAFLAAAASRKMVGTVFVWDEKTNSLVAHRSQHRNQTAMVCFSDTLAGHLLNACRSLDLQVPRDLSVTGFDSSTFCERTTPRLTSVYQPVERIAFEATNHLISLVEAEPPNQVPASTSAIYDCALDVRDSTCPPLAKRGSS